MYEAAFNILLDAFAALPARKRRNLLHAAFSWERIAVGARARVYMTRSGFA